MNVRPSAFACLLVATMVVASGCHSDGLYDSCPMSKSILEACGVTEGEGESCTSDGGCEAEGLSCIDGVCTDGTAFTCVVAEHPFCLEEICASWQGAPAVCTRSCVVDDDCPGVGTCVTHQGLQFCVEGTFGYEDSPFFAEPSVETPSTDQLPSSDDLPSTTSAGAACTIDNECPTGQQCCALGTQRAETCAPVGTCDDGANE